MSDVTQVCATVYLPMSRMLAPYHHALFKEDPSSLTVNGANYIQVAYATLDPHFAELWLHLCFFHILRLPDST